MSSTQAEQRTSAKLKLAVGAIGIVFGDIGTSPLYAFRETFVGPHPLALDDLHVLGVVSLIFWSMTLVVSIQYVALLMSADDQALLLIFNAHFEPVDFALPQMAPHWTTLIDTATAWAGIDGNRVRDSRCGTPSRSLLLLEAGS